MVNIYMFSLEIQKKLTQSGSFPWLAASKGVSPYLSVEYKSERAGQPALVARHQIAAAAAIWLFMRKELREAISTSPCYHDIRHYGFVITASHFEVWEATIDDNQDYKVACKMEGLLSEPAHLRRFINWSNAIHMWGLGPNAESFRKDIEELIGQRENNSVSS